MHPPCTNGRHGELSRQSWVPADMNGKVGVVLQYTYILYFYDQTG